MAKPRPTGVPDVRGSLRLPGIPLARAGFPLLVLALLAALEVFARKTRTDAEDAFGVAGLALVALLVRGRHRRAPLAPVTRLLDALRRLGAAAKRETASLGIDLRGDPPLPRAFPPILGGAVAALAAVAVLLAAFPALEPVAVRGAVRAVSGAGWLLLLGGGWVLLGGGAFYLLFLAFALTHDELVRSHKGPGPRPRGREALAMAGWTAALLAGWTLLPSWAPLAVHASCLAAALVALALPGGPDVPLLWKRGGGERRVFATSWRTHTLAGTAWVALLLADATLFLGTGDLRGRDGAAAAAVLPFTTGLASLFAWTGAAALAAWCHLVLRIALLARLRDPSRPRPVPVFVAGRLSARERRGARDDLEGAGFRVRFAPGRPGPTDAVVEPGAGGTGFGPALSLRDLAAPDSRRRIVRRHEVRCRRLLARGLQTLFRRASARRFRQGTGFWVAPWHWFCIGLSRDEDERVLDGKEGTFFLETVGPAYHRVFPPEALAHVRRVMRDLQVDLVFVEDGVGFRRFRRVLRMAFEVHDMLGSGGRAEDRHFTGLPGVRVLLIEFTMEEPFRAKRPGYPEPDYETVGRARILHVFRDRGESEETADAPRDRRGEPLLA